MRILFFYVILLVSNSAMAADASVLKGMYFYNFIRFTTWPKYIDTAKEVRVGVFDAQDFSDILRKISEKTHYRPKMLVDDCHTLDCVDNVQVIFMRGITEVKQQYILEHLAGTPVLTISDEIGFLKIGGMIELQEFSGRLVFSVNLPAFNQSGLYISADILDMAQEVIRKVPKP